jgi:hypothetical protein
MTYTPKLGDKPFQSRCKSCVFFARDSESWEMDHYYWFVCRKRPANESLKTFPFKNGCKHHTTEQGE